MKTINLAGQWEAELDGVSYDFKLPGSTCDNKIGKKREYFDELNQESVRAPLEKYEYVGKICISREIDVPAETAGKSVRLFLERVNVASSLYVDGNQIGRQIISLSTPHVYDLTDKLTPGKHTFTLELDNSDLVSLANYASGYSVDTQGYWNGVIGRIELQWENKCHIKAADVFPKKDKSLEIKFALGSDERTPEKNKVAKLVLSVEKPDGGITPEKEYEIKLFATRHYSYVNFQLDEVELWDEFDPKLYTLHAKLLVDDAVEDEKKFSFGIRFFEAVGKEFHLNGHRIAIRGNVDCAQFPKTGYPPMTDEIWKHNLGMMKDWGLNMVRFHGWCPPEVAFEVADSLGMYIQVEMPLWLNVDVTKIELGEDPAQEIFFRNEAIAIMRNYGNHPSFLFFSNGNENMGDYGFLEDNIRMLKSMDDRHLYAITSNFDHPVGPVEDYFLAQHAYGMPVRNQDIQDEVAENTAVNFDKAVDSIPVPLMNFEVGQYAVYPDVDIIADYDGNMLPVNFDAIKKSMIKVGVYDRRDKYIKASGDMSWRLYKEDVESVYRTKAMNGYQLLCVQDYPGQDTATVGIFDVMYRDKGLVPKERWRQFVGPVVPLFEAKRIYSSEEKLVAKLGLYDYGKEPIKNPVYNVKITKTSALGEETFFETSTTDEKMQVELSDINEASKLTVYVSVEDHTNCWNVYVYPTVIPGEIEAASVKLQNPVSCQYIPVFWSPVMFETDKPSGAIIDKEHPIFKDFPTDVYPDFQWKKLLDNAVAVDMKELNFEAKPLIELVPNFWCNKYASVLLEGMVEGQKVLYCGLDLDIEDLPTKQLKYCIENYVRENDVKLYQMVKA